MKKLIVMLLAMALMGLLNLDTVTYADDKDHKDDKDKKDDPKKVAVCVKKDHKFTLIEVKLDEVKDHLKDDAFFPKGEVFWAEDKDKAIVKFLCDFKDKKDNKDKNRSDSDNGHNGHDKDFKDIHVLICLEKDHKVKLIEVKLDEVKKYLHDDAFFPKDKVLKEDKDKAIVKFLCHFDKKDHKETIYPFHKDKDFFKDKDLKEQAPLHQAAIGTRQTALVV